MLDQTVPRLPQYQAYHAYRVTPSKATVSFAARPTTSYAPLAPVQQSTLPYTPKHQQHLQSSRSLGDLVLPSQRVATADTSSMKPLKFRPTSSGRPAPLEPLTPLKLTDLELPRRNAGPFDYFQHKDVKLSFGRILPRATRPDRANLDRSASSLAYVGWCGRSPVYMSR